MSYGRASVDLNDCDREPINTRKHAAARLYDFFDPTFFAMVYVSSTIGERLDSLNLATAHSFTDIAR